MWTFEVYAGSSGQYNWRLFADNGQNVASSGEPFACKANAERAANGFKAGAASAKCEIYESSASKLALARQGWGRRPRSLANARR